MSRVTGQKKEVKTRSPDFTRIANCTGCQWTSRSSKVDFHLIWKGVDLCDFLIVINSNLGPISHHFWDMATYSLKFSIENCGQSCWWRHGYYWQSIRSPSALSNIWYHCRPPTTYRLDTIPHDWRTIVHY